MSRDDYTISIRGAGGFVETDPLEGWTKLEAVLRHARFGTWMLDGIDADSSAAELVVPGAGIVVRRLDEVLFSGPIARRRRVRAKGTNLLYLSGFDDLVNLWDRFVYPDPTSEDWTVDAYDVAGPDAAETVIRHFVDVSAGPSALSYRQVDGLTLADDQARGSTVTGRGRLQNLGDFLVELAVAGGDLGLTIEQAEDGSGIVFDVYEPADLSDSIVFAVELENLRGFDYELEAGDGNVITAGGGGEETARVFVSSTDADSVSRWGRRIERFVDQRQTTDLDELTQKTTEELDQRADQEKATLDVVDTEGLTFGSDYNLGDRATVLVDDVPVVEVIREVRFVIDGRGETITPVVSSPGAALLDHGVGALMEQVRRLRARVGNTEHQ